MNKHNVLRILATLVIIGFAGIAYADLSDGLVAYYPFNGNANDESGNGNNGTVYQATLTKDRFGNMDSAYDFNGVDAFVEVPDAPNLNFGSTDFTISLWVNFRDLSDEQILIEKWIDDPYREGWSLLKLAPNDDRGGNAIFFAATGADRWWGGGLLRAMPVISENTWNHVVVTRQGNSYALYFNDILLDSFTHIADLSVQTPLLIGRRGGWQGFFLKGLIDDIRIYNRALSEDEIQELYNMSVSVPCRGDFDCDGDVDGSDLAIFAADFGRTDCEAEILGTWIGDEDNGQLNSWGFVLSCNGLDVVGPQEWYRGTFLLNKAANPYQIDFLITASHDGGNTGKISLGIYQVEGNTLTIAFNEPGFTTRPSTFTPNWTRVFLLSK